jgi:hypothetical protein
LRHPLDRLVRHRLYNRLMQFMPPTARAVPWQAYPGSEPCPLPLPPGIGTQWQTWHSPAREREIHLANVARAGDVLAAKHFPDWLISRPVLRLAHGLLRLGMQRYGHLFEAALPFVTYPPRRELSYPSP